MELLWGEHGCRVCRVLFRPVPVNAGGGDLIDQTLVDVFEPVIHVPLTVKTAVVNIVDFLASRVDELCYFPILRVHAADLPSLILKLACHETGPTETVVVSDRLKAVRLGNSSVAEGAGIGDRDQVDPSVLVHLDIPLVQGLLEMSAAHDHPAGYPAVTT